MRIGKLLFLAVMLIGNSANADDLNEMYGLGVLEPASGGDSDYYIQVMGQRSSLKDAEIENSSGTKLGEAKFDSGYGLSAALGYRVSSSMRAEAEFMYNQNDVETSVPATIDDEIKSYAVMGNLILDFMPGEFVNPFVGGGAGYARITDGDLEDDVFAYQGMAGLEFQVIEDLKVVARYKYFATQDAEFDKGAGVTMPYADHSAEIGLRLGL